jgi:hypothetical protein
VLNEIFYGLKLEKSVKSFMSESSFEFEEREIPANPEIKGMKDGEVFSTLITKRHPFFKPETSRVGISVEPKNSGIYIITESVSFKTPGNILSEYKNLEKVLLPLAEKTRKYESKSSFSNFKTDHTQFKLKKEYGSGFVEIKPNFLFEKLDIMYTNNPEMDFVADKK